MIRHLMFLHSSGVPLFTTSFEKGIDCCSQEHKHHTAIIEKSSLFSGFLTSINALASEFGGSIRHMKLGQWDVFVDASEDLTGVLLANPSDDHNVHDRYSSALSELKSKFIQIHQKDLGQWDGEISKFVSFQSVVNSNDIISFDTENVELCTSCINVVNDAIKEITS